MSHYFYLIIDLACISIPLIASFYKKAAFFKEWKYFFPANLIVAIIFLIWDEIFTRNGVWGFNPDYLVGIYLGELPLEEILFFICIPYACVFTYFAFKYFLSSNIKEYNNTWINYLLMTLALVIALFSTDKIYTFVTASSATLFFLWAAIKKENLTLLNLSYLAIIPFFLMSNGLLTGSLIDSPIVWYDHSENWNTRIFTIPVEDTLYGYVLIALNVVLYERIKQAYSN